MSADNLLGKLPVPRLRVQMGGRIFLFDCWAVHIAQFLQLVGNFLANVSAGTLNNIEFSVEQRRFSNAPAKFCCFSDPSLQVHELEHLGVVCCLQLLKLACKVFAQLDF